MNLFSRVVLAAVLVAAVFHAPGADYDTGKNPLYLGAQACSECHASGATGHQFSQWRSTAHARAYAVLASPEAKAIARLSGIPGEPQQAPMCLGCHATAAEAEDWERLDGFHVEDGLQCEACHGPGSEYATREVMLDRRKAMTMGLRIPDRGFCLNCHRAKGSHQAVLQAKPWDAERAWKEIAHPIVRTNPPAPAAPPPQRATENKFVGGMACAQCHQAPAMGYQFSQWRLTPHARAYAVLASTGAVEIARKEGVAGDPQQSPQCLKCHTTGQGYVPESFAESFHFREGVDCEACHGPGGRYAGAEVMRDAPAARHAGLAVISQETCRPCHETAHGKPFNYAEALAKIRHPKPKPAAAAAAPGYKTPLNMALSPDGRELWVVCESSHTVVVVDTQTLRTVAEIPVGGQPTDVAFDPAGKRAFVSNRLDDSVSVVDVARRSVTSTIAVGDEPHGVLLDREGRNLYVLNTSTDSVSVFDTATLREVKRLTASRFPWSLALSPDGSQILVTHALSRFAKPLQPSVSEIMVIDTARAVVEERHAVPGANLLQGIAWHPSGQYGVFTLVRTKNVLPMTRVARGWTIANALGIVWRDGRVDQLPLDQPGLGFADPTDVAVTPDGRRALVSSSSSDRVAVLDLDKMVCLLTNASAADRERVLPNHLGIASEYTIKYIPVRNSPRGIVCSADGARAYVANALDDSLTVIDLARLEATGLVALGGTSELTQQRRGERLFNSAGITFHRQFSCHTCHPDGHVDGLAYDIEPDGIGVSPVDNRTLRGIIDMAPFKWEGTNPSLKRQCGPRLSVFFTRMQPFTPDQLEDLHSYICTIPRPPNRYRKLGQPLTPAQSHGKLIFERTRANDGREIPPGNRCVACHAPPLYTDGKAHDVGTRMPNDRQGRFDAPHLCNIYDSAPYLHNGMAESLEEIWTTFNPNDQHGQTNDMTKDQLNDLIEYLKTL